MVDVVALVSALIAHAVTDLGAGGSSILAPVLSAYSQAISTAADGSDAGELVGLKYLERLLPPDGVCIQFTPNWSEDISAVPGPQMRVDLMVEIKATLKDYPGNALSGQVGEQGRFMTALAVALSKVFDPASLGAVDGGWTVAASPSYVVLNPLCRVLDPVAEEDIRGQVAIVAELDFTGFTYYSL